MDSQKLCPICKKCSKEQYLPFCSQRCSQIDLGNWFTEKYMIPGEQIEDDQGNIILEKESELQ